MVFTASFECDGVSFSCTVRAFMQVTTKLQWMSVGSIARVDSDQYASLPWLSEHTTIDTVKVAHLLRLPHPGGKGAPRTVTCKELEITPDVRKVGLHMHNWRA